MTIKEIEEKTGLGRSNIRFYEKEKLISPQRNENNGYREYAESDLSDIRKIAYLRTLGVSIEDIRSIMDGKQSLYETVRQQAAALEDQIADLEAAKRMCAAMLDQKNLSYANLAVEQYVPDMRKHWKANRNILKMDAVGFLYLWGGLTVWGIIALGSILLALCSFGTLPQQIPVQWSGSTVTSLVDKKFIFVYPAACVLIRFLLRPFIWQWVNRKLPSGDTVSDYLTNFICFAALSMQVFTLLFVNGLAEHVTTVLFVDAAVLLGMLAAGWYQLMRKQEK